ncbi:hypothetical protein IMZ48_41125 [Candidatus Bathyarchaeota archaeon]|nr:hypothetical protein [Candidatus Bathyarchaeota archaeon]
MVIEYPLGSRHAKSPTPQFGHGAAKTMDARAATELHNMLDFQNQISSSDSGDEAGGPAFRPARRKPPKLQSLRMNLTALSQVYNLYFAAYRNKIWVYRPAGPMAQGLGEKPALVISHTVSSVGAKIPMRPQVKWNGDEANHMIVGFLGDVEILLLCYENGDVTSYYTREIADYIAHRAQHPDSAPRPCPRPFFRANVGISAWGLAIHSKSRLIAVSSNRPEVTVFAFALTHAPAPGRFLTPPHTPAESAVLARKRNWRIVLAPKRSGGNIPNVDFVSSPLGHAQKISAADIHGCIWILDIWRQEIAPEPIVPQDTRWTRTQNRM